MRTISLVVLAWIAGCGGSAAQTPDSGNSDAPSSDGRSIDSAAVESARPVADGSNSDAADTAPVDDTPDTADTTGFDASSADGGRLAAETILLTLDAGAFPPTPMHPSALVYVPNGYDRSPPLHVIVYLHGFDNCISNIVNETGASCDPANGTPVRSAYNLAAQLEASGKNAILLCPELAFDQPTGNPGTLGTSGGFRALLSETLLDLAPILGAKSLADVAEIIVAANSGGYQAAAGIAERGTVPVQEIWLFDSLYGNTTDYDDWVKQDLSSFATVQRRFADIYTTGGGTLFNSQAMAVRAVGWVSNNTGSLVDDRSNADWTADMYRHGLLFKLSALASDAVPRSYFGPLLQTSSLPDR